MLDIVTAAPSTRPGASATADEALSATPVGGLSASIFAAGYFGYGNFGDELILDIFTRRMSPRRVTHVKRMKTRPVAVIAAIVNSGAVVFPGGSVFQDETSSLSFFFYASVIFTAALFSKPVFLLDSGFEVKKTLNRIILRRALRLASFISVRDSASFETLRALGLNPLKSADCAFSLESFVCRGLFPPETIGVIPRKNRKHTEEAINRCRKKWPAAKFKFAVLSALDLSLAKQLGGGTDTTLIKNQAQAEKFYGACDFFVLAPYHAMALAAKAGANFTAVAYSLKVTNFLTEIKGDENGKTLARRMRIAEECAFQIFLNLLKDKLKL